MHGFSGSDDVRVVGVAHQSGEVGLILKRALLPAQDDIGG